MTAATTPVRRAFADLDFGQMHYRYAGQGSPLLLLHASPGSSRQLEPLIARLGGQFSVIAPDTPGNGDSAPLPLDAPSIEDFAGAALQFIDVLGLGSVDLYGSHTGACIASELALLAPGRVRRVVQDGIVVFNEAERRELIERYAQPFAPDLAGTQLLRAFLFCRDQFVFFPWYACDREHQRDGGLPPAGALHDWVVDVLKAATTYHRAYRAAFAYPADARLARLGQPVLGIAAEDDPLAPQTRAVIEALPNGRFEPLPRFDDPAYLERLAAAIAGFLAE